MLAWKCVKNEHIRDIISIIGSTSATPTMLSKKLKIDPVAMSRYLKVLRDDKLVKVRRDQNKLWYSLHQNNWKKHIEATLNLSGGNFVVSVKNIYKKPTFDVEQQSEIKTNDN